MSRLFTIMTAALALFAVTAVSATAGSTKQGTKVTRGTTTFTPDAGTLQALTAAGVAVTPAKPAKASGDGFSLPITNGRVKRSDDGLDGVIKHVGGVTLAKGETTLTLRNARIELDADGQPAATSSTSKSRKSDDGENELTAIVGDERIDVADLAVSGASVDTEGRKLTITGIAATLTQEAADALNAAFGTTFSAGDALGELAVATRYNGRRAAKKERSSSKGGERRGRRGDHTASERRSARGGERSAKGRGRNAG